ncbi:MAG: phenylalanine--tRNA ligase subunit beta [Deltaproteobacteria bacterium]|nr:phenylalanine--tRNA ligase subunit beta [Deltaproteobacteria bacterium]
MKISLNWIREWIKIDASAEEIAEKLSMSGLEVEALEKLGAGLDQVVTAEILSKEKHPNADRLSVCEVSNGQENIRLVCGAQNMKAGDKVALAVPGVTLPNGLTLKETEIRKVKSLGMLCSESELGLAEESSGIMILPEETPLGIPLNEALGLNDEILEINVTPNRGDCLSVLGIAREIAANFSLLLQKKLPSYDQQNSNLEGQKSSDSIRVQLESDEACRRYCGRIIRGVKISESPQWMQARLAASGIRSINNVVDASNYIMLEYGQPLHAFDLAKIGGAEIKIRSAKSGETLRTLEGKELQLKPENLVIADAAHPMALAGVMGGEDSGVSEATRDLFLESAYFEASGIRKTSRAFAMQTESSYRFERSTDPEICVAALRALSDLILKIAGGQADSKIIDLYPKPVQKSQITLRASRVQKILGFAFSAQQIQTLLEPLQIETQVRGEELLCEVPSFRSDLTREIDLIEEVARLYGYQNIPTTYPELDLKTLTNSKPKEKDLAIQSLRQTLLSWGFSELIHYSFTSPKLLQQFEQSYAAEQVLANPISEELSVMRPSLLPQMVQTLQKNIHKSSNQLKFFEMRRVYHFRQVEGEDRPFEESLHLCLGMTGDFHEPYFAEKNQAVSFLDLKSYLLEIAQKFGKKIRLIKNNSIPSFFMPTRYAEILMRNSQLGQVGELHPRVLKDLDLAQSLVVAEINLDLVLTETKNKIEFKKLSPYPSIFRDLNLIVDEKVTCEEVSRLIKQKGGSHLLGFYLFDLYRGEPIDQSKKALTFRLEYASNERTLTDDEVNEARENLLKILNDKLGASLR